MKILLIASFSIFYYLNNCLAQKKDKIVIETRVDTALLTDSITLEYAPIEHPSYPVDLIRLKQPRENLKWVVNTDEPLYILVGAAEKLGMTWLGIFEPGDSIIITKKNGSLQFSGTGAEKLKLRKEIIALMQNIRKLPDIESYSHVVEGYRSWNEYLNNLQQTLITIVDSYQGKISPLAYLYTKAGTIRGIEEYRHDNFNKLRKLYWSKGEASGITNSMLCHLFDSTFYSEPAKWMRSLPIGMAGNDGFIENRVLRKYQFLKENDSMQSRIKRKLRYYEEGKRIYNGLARERFLMKLVTYDIIRKTGFTPEVEALLAKYYKDSNDPRYRAFVKQYEMKYRELREEEPAPDFSLTDSSGNTFSKSDLKGKVALIDFWFTGCSGCIEMAPALKKVEAAFENDSNVTFLSVSTDKAKTLWKESVKQQKYTTGKGIQLYTDGKGQDHQIVKQYNISAYPDLYLLDSEGRIAANPVPDPRKDSGRQLIELIRQQLALAQDGPYVTYEGDKMAAYFISGMKIHKKAIYKGDSTQFEVQTDEYGRTFPVKLKRNLSTEPSEFAKPEKLFVVSDIEGNFTAFRKLLQSNGVIDEKYNWTFGNGHLVCNGDFFDRGKQVTEVLWLIYALEEKARKAGGYVHYILGNHEIMNLSGDTRYVKQKYKGNAWKLRKSYTDLYSTESELGRWLRTKNIVEKIGDILFMHAGLSKEVSALSLSVDSINRLARPYYTADSVAEKSTNKALSLIYNTKLSPFWYREYYLDEEKKIMLGGSKGRDTIYKTPAKVIDLILKKYEVNRIVTGHTIVQAGDQITLHYEGKVINTDTRHAQGKSEALLIENDKYYRANTTAQKFLIMDEGTGYTKNTP